MKLTHREFIVLFGIIVIIHSISSSKSSTQCLLQQRLYVALILGGRGHFLQKLNLSG